MYVYRAREQDNFALIKDTILLPMGKEEMLICQIDLKCYPVSKNISFLRARNADQLIKIPHEMFPSKVGYLYPTFYDGMEISKSRNLRHVL